MVSELFELNDLDEQTIEPALTLAALVNALRKYEASGAPGTLAALKLESDGSAILIWDGESVERLSPAKLQEWADRWTYE